MSVKKISIIGVGKLGLSLALNLERKKFSVLGVDVDQNYVQSLNDKTYKSSEPFITDYLQESKNISFTTDLKLSLDNDVIFIVVKTPSTREWKYDHSQIDSVIESLIGFGKQSKRKDLIINSTTFPGYCDSLQKKLNQYNYYVSYNPEFIAQGNIIKDQVLCDNVLIGAADKTAEKIIKDIYSSIVESNPVFNIMSRTEAEITKLSVNCFLTTKISFANMIGDIAIRHNCDPDKILNAVGTDSRIGNKYLKYGFGFGGPCFPRDNRALYKCAEEVNIDAELAKVTDDMNERHLNYQIQLFVKNNPDKTKIVDIDYVTYKKDSIIIEESQQLKFAIKLQELGYKLNVLDKRPEVIEQIKNILL
ncbi:MAG: Synechococcus phage [Bacteroidota bacterium]|jgi:nucleotide sugar dehydrogenase